MPGELLPLFRRDTSGPVDAHAVLSDAGAIVRPIPTDPMQVISPIPAHEAPVINLDSETLPPAAVVPMTATGNGLMNWAKQNPVLATAAALAIAYVIYKQLKK